MVHTGIFATSSECVSAAGAAYNSTFVTEAKVNEFCLQAESTICDLTNYNWVDAWTAGLNADKKYILSECEAALVGIKMIRADPRGYPARTAEFMVDCLYTEFWRCIRLLQSAQGSTFVQAA